MMAIISAEYRRSKAQRPSAGNADNKAFSSEVVTGSREENASDKDPRPWFFQNQGCGAG
jgi:hypothetical protein